MFTLNEMANYDALRHLITLVEKDVQIEKILSSQYCFEQRIIYAIQNNEAQLVNGVANLEQYKGCVLKIEAVERLSPLLQEVCETVGKFWDHKGPITCHLFISPEGSKSFDLHTDPDDVYLYMLKGHKAFNVEEDYVELKEGDGLFIPKNTLHQALTYADSIMLSFGLELFIEDKF